MSLPRPCARYLSRSILKSGMGRERKEPHAQESKSPRIRHASDRSSINSPLRTKKYYFILVHRPKCDDLRVCYLLSCSFITTISTVATTYNVYNQKRRKRTNIDHFISTVFHVVQKIQKLASSLSLILSLSFFALFIVFSFHLMPVRRLCLNTSLRI